LKREILLFLVIFILLTTIQHPDIYSSPIVRISELPKAGAYGLGAMHPFVFTFIVYIVVSLILFVTKKIKKIIKREKV
jgi:hypothetical protein